MPTCHSGLKGKILVVGAGVVGLDKRTELRTAWV